MSKLKIAIIGAGSSYTPEIVEKLSEMREQVPVKEIVLMDIHEERTAVMTSFCKRFAEHLDYPVEIWGTTDRKRAIDGSDYVITQLRVGGNAARVNDEKIPLKYGLVGQETTGPGGFMKALRTIPVMLDIAHDLEKYSPQAWIVNYTNPTGIVAEAVTKYSKARIAGLCAGGLFPKVWAEKALGVKQSGVKYDYFGLNHMNFSYNVKIDGRDLTGEEFDRIAEVHPSLDSEIVKKLGLIPSPYLQYFFTNAHKVESMKKAQYTRGEEVQMLEKEIFTAYADEKLCTKPAILDKRGGGGYSEVAIGLIDAIHNDRDKWMVVNVPNQGAIRFLPDDAVVEIGCMVNSAGIKPLALNDIPETTWGLVCAVKNYEQLTVKAAVSGDKDKALLALLANPLVRDYNIAQSLLNDLLEANKDYLPQFYQ